MKLLVILSILFSLSSFSMLDEAYRPFEQNALVTKELSCQGIMNSYKRNGYKNEEVVIEVFRDFERGLVLTFLNVDTNGIGVEDGREEIGLLKSENDELVYYHPEGGEIRLANIEGKEFSFTNTVTRMDYSEVSNWPVICKMGAFRKLSQL